MSETRTRRRRRLGVVALVTALAAGAFSLPASAADDLEPWRILSELRTRLVDRGTHAREFEQTYVPAGFSSGETEPGRAVFRLPGCLRWDYRQPYPRSFLLCGELLHAWTPGDPTGQIHEVDRRRQPGLDLLALDADRLRERYRATATTIDSGVRITLEPRDPDDRPARELEWARIVLGDDSDLRSLTYADGDGNRTRFTFDEPTAVTETAGLFTPPRDVTWRRHEAVTDLER